MIDSLSAATCAIYGALILPVWYVLFIHRREGAFGWFFLSLFCALRIVGGGLGVKSSSPAAGIISSVGLSPLLLATCGILYEARIYCCSNFNRQVEWMCVLVFHFVVVGAVALTAVGVSRLQEHHPSIYQDKRLAEAGISVLAACWGGLSGMAGLTFVNRRTGSKGRPGTVLLASVCFALLPIGVRVFYTIVALVTQTAFLNPITGSLAVRVVLGFLTELIATLAFVSAGLITGPSEGKERCDNTAHQVNSAPCVWAA